MTEPNQDPLRRLAAAAGRVCRLAKASDVFDEYDDSDETLALRRALVDLDDLLDEFAAVDPPPRDLPAPTVAGVLAVLLALPDAPGVEKLAGHLDGDQIEELLRVALAMSDKDRQVSLLLAFAPYLSAAQAERALPAVPTMMRAYHQALTLVALLPRLPERRRPAAVRFALAAARRIGAAGREMLVTLAPWINDDQRAELYEIASRGDRNEPLSALAWLAGHLRPEHRQVTLDAVAAVADGNLRAALLVDLAPHLDDAQLTAATAAAADITDPGYRARGLAGLARSLPEDRRREVVALALAAAAEPAGRRHSYLAWDNLLPLLGPDQLDDALAAVGAVEDENLCAHGLTKLATHLAPDQLSAALSTAATIGDPRARVIALVALIPRLPSGLRDTASAAAVAALTARPGAGWFRELAALAPHLTAAQIAELWDVAVEEEREYPQHGLPALAPYVDRARRDRALELVLGYRPVDRPDALAELAPHLDAEQRERALRTVRRIGKPAEWARTAAALAPYLPPGRAGAAWEEALSAAARLRDPATRAGLLTELASRLDGERRDTALALAFAAGMAIPAEERGHGFDALTALVPLLDDSAASPG